MTGPVRRPTELDRHRFPVDEWRLVETEYDPGDLGHTETIFAAANGYLGLRSNPPEGRDAHSHGTFINGFHETWPIMHAESAHAFARTGQTIVNVPDAKLMKLYVDDEPLRLGSADLESYERSVDFRSGIVRRDLVWRTPAGKRVRVSSSTMASLTHRHLAVLTLDVTMLAGSAPVVVSSQLLNRQDGEDEYHIESAALGEGTDPRQSRRFGRRVLVPNVQRGLDDDGNTGGGVVLGHRCAESRMTIASAYRHEVDSDGTPLQATVEVRPDHAKTVLVTSLDEGGHLRVTKYVAYHTSTGVPCEELADRCARTLDRAVGTGRDRLEAEQRAWLDEFWRRSDLVVGDDPAAQQSLRWNLFQLAQASAATQDAGIAAKGVTAAGYEGHYFWDTEVYVVPFLAQTDPEAARRLLLFRHRLLDAARRRATELSQRGALYPWRTINGEEGSAYYAAGTAQYHINAAVAYTLERYVETTGDTEFLRNEGAEILVETARLWEDLGFYAPEDRSTDRGRFHIHRVTGPDEYTTVVNDNLYTNVMARFNLRFAARTVREIRAEDAMAYERLARATGLADDEVDAWDRAADEMYLPFDAHLGIHPQDEAFLDLEPWDFAGTPAEQYPLLLNFHPLVIYRHQVLKQADVVLAMYLRGEHFDLDTKRRNFDYYDPITTGDSSLSACVQSIMAATVGRDDLAHRYLAESLTLDLVDSHGNTSDGVHVANAGGVWAAVVHGLAGVRTEGPTIHIEPRPLPGWSSVSFSLRHRGSRFRVHIDADATLVEHLEGNDADLVIAGAPHTVGPGRSARGAGAPSR